jgi:hypothetical protein
MTPMEKLDKALEGGIPEGRTMMLTGDERPKSAVIHRIHGWRWGQPLDVVTPNELLMGLGLPYDMNPCLEQDLGRILRGSR